VVRQAVADRFGPVGSLGRLNEGEEAQVWRFTSKGEDFVVRVSPLGFDKDRFAHDRWHSTTLPIPEVVALGEVAGLPYCVSRRLPGTTVQDADRPTLRRITGAVDGVLHALAEADVDGTSGYGGFDADGRGAYTSWQEFLSSPEDGDYPGVDPVALRELRAAVRDLRTGCPETRRLVHGDFGSNNLLTDGRRITGVLDWDMAAFGDPLYDVANILLWRDWLDCMRIQAEHVEAQPPDDPDAWHRLRCYQLHSGLTTLEWFATRDNPAMVQDMTAHLLTLIPTQRPPSP
jgi:hygromycin-B 4-O-kinase